MLKVTTTTQRATFLGAGLLFVLSGCAGSEEPAPAEETQASGFLRPATSQPAVVQAAEKAPAALESVPAPAPQDEPRAAHAPASEPALPESLPAADASDLEIASCLLHEPYSAFEQLVDRRRESLPEPRRQLLLSFAAAKSGQISQDQERKAAELESSGALTPQEFGLLQRALASAAASPGTSTLALATPLERAMELSLLEREASEFAARGVHAAAARAWSGLLLAEIGSPWEADRRCLARWSAALAAEQASHRWNPGGDWPSIEVKVLQGDSLIGIRKRVLGQHPELLLCTGLLARANGLRDEEAIRPDDLLRVPTDRPSALVDLSSRWTFYLHGDEVVAAWEVGVGKEEGSTRPGTYTITLKHTEPMWFRPGMAPVPFGAPENPLGSRWLEWGQDGKGTHLGFHGTDDPSGVGGRVSEGCVRMRNDDVELLYDILPLGATVIVQP